MKKVTIQDIAAEMGLSRNTVAKALNGGIPADKTCGGTESLADGVYQA